jgi:hypothetical protein
MTHTYTIHVVGAGARPQRCGHCRTALPHRPHGWPEGNRVGISMEGSHAYLIDDGRPLDEDEALCVPTMVNSAALGRPL